MPENFNPVWPGRPGQAPGLVQGSPDTKFGRNTTVRKAQPAQGLLQADGRCEDGFVATIHAQVQNVVFPPGVTHNRRCAVVGLLQWGQGGATFKAEIDLRTGVCATIVASGVSMQAMLEPSLGESPDGTALSADVSAAIVWGTRSSRGRATRTKRLLVPANTDGAIEVPPFAYSVSLYAPDVDFYDEGSNTCLMTFAGGPTTTDDPQATFALSPFIPQLIGSPDGLLLPGHTRYIILTNNLADDLTLTATFGLAL
jgi:hypothetical protein